MENSTEWFTILRERGDWRDIQWGPRKISLGRKTSNTMYFQRLTQPLMQLIVSNINSPISSSWGNWYKDGIDHAGYHKDNYGNITIYTISFGGTRNMLFKPDDRTKPTIKITLNSGDMYSFDSVINKQYTHSIPRSKTNTDERISVLFFGV